MMTSCKIIASYPFFHSFFDGFVIGSTTFGRLMLCLHSAGLVNELPARGTQSRGL
jgi:hypothetical protein